MGQWKEKYPNIIKDIRGKGLLLLIEFADSEIARKVSDECLKRKLFVRQTQGNGIRVFPALNIKAEELNAGLAIMQTAIESVMG